MDRNPVLLYKTLVIGVILLLLCMIFTPSIAIDNVKKSTYPIGSGNTLYVGGNGTGNYTSIQDAINDTNEGDTVFVYNDSSPYYENVVIDKSINLIGEDKNTTIIYRVRDNYTIYVLDDANEVTITGFTLRRSIEYFCAIIIFSNYNNINNNNIYDKEGISLEGSIGNNISSNMLWVSDYGIILNGSEENNIYNNYFFTGSLCRGVSLHSSSNNNIVLKNTIVNSGIGVRLSSSSNNNIVSKNTIDGSGLGSIGILLLISSNSNIVSKNTIVDCSECITIVGDNNDINNNMLIDNLYACINIWGNNNLIYKNNISCICNGIYIGEGSKNNDIYENYIKSCQTGVRLLGAKDNNIHRNNIIKCGVGLIYSDYSIKNRIYENNFINNKNHCSWHIYLVEIPLTIIFRNKFDRNYWGEPLSSPKVIKGHILIISFWEPGYIKLFPSFQFDWHPAKEPYDIEV